jgi:phosphatidylglycerophosphate synthase
MSGKELMLDFLTYAFLIFLICFCIVFFIAGDRVEMVSDFIKSLFPLAIFGVFFLIKTKFGRQEFKKRSKENNLDITLRLTYIDKLISNLITFSLPILIIAIALFFKGKVDFVDIIQASAAFLVMYLWEKRLFNRE